MDGPDGDEYGGGGGMHQGDDGMQDDMYADDGAREDVDQQQEEGMDTGEGRMELMEEAPAQPIDKSKRFTTRYMTKYERARVLGTRALQIRYIHYGFDSIFFNPCFLVLRHIACL